MVALRMALVMMALTGCSINGRLTLDQVRQMSSDDLKAAEAKAALADDKPGMWCWQFLQAVPSPPGSAIGVASAIEDTRLVAMAAAGPCSGIMQPVIGIFGAL